MKTAEEYLESWLGGNMNTVSLTPFAICEFARYYHTCVTIHDQEKQKLNDQEELYHLCQYSEGVCVWCGHIKNLPDEQDELLNNSEK